MAGQAPDEPAAFLARLRPILADDFPPPTSRHSRQEQSAEPVSVRDMYPLRTLDFLQ